MRDVEGSQKDVEPSVVVVGGGIAGLYCARELAECRYTVTVLEIRDEFGGRVETAQPKGFESPASNLTTQCMTAELGPMRFEVPIQPLFCKLCNGDLELDLRKFRPTGEPPV